MKRTRQELARLGNVIGLVYEGATDPSRWTRDILPALCEYIGAPACVLFTPFVLPRDGGLVFAYGISQAQVELYALYQGEDIQAQAAVAKGLAFEGNVVIDSEILPRQQLLESKYYREFLAREDLAQLMNTVVFGPNSASGVPLTVCSFWRGLAAPPFAAQDKERLKLLSSHISRSLGVMQRLRSAELNVATSLAAFDRLQNGVLLVDAKGAVVFANRTARRIIEDGDGLRLRKLTNSPGLGELVAADPATARAINVAISEILKNDPHDTPHFSECVTVPRNSGAAGYILQFSALGEHNDLGSAGGLYRGIIFIADGAKAAVIDPALLQTAYGLTPAEAKVAIALLESGSAQDVADRLGKSPNTVRSHIRQVYAKLNVDTRARFVKLMLGLAT